MCKYVRELWRKGIPETHVLHNLCKDLVEGNERFISDPQKKNSFLNSSAATKGLVTGSTPGRGVHAKLADL